MNEIAGNEEEGEEEVEEEDAGEPGENPPADGTAAKVEQKKPSAAASSQATYKQIQQLQTLVQVLIKSNTAIKQQVTMLTQKVVKLEK